MYERIINVQTEKGVFSYKILGINEDDYIIEPYSYIFTLRLSDFRRIYVKGKKRRILQHYYKHEHVTIHYSSLKEEYDKEIIDLFLKYLPTKKEIEETKQKNLVSIKK